MTTVSSGLSGPEAVATDGTFIYLVDIVARSVYKVDPATGVYSLLLGTGALSNATPRAMTTDGTNLYVADYAAGVIQKIVLATNTVSTYLSGFSYPNAMTTDGVNLYVADYSGIKKINLSSNAITQLTAVPVVEMTTDGSRLYIINGFSIQTVNLATGVMNSFAGSVTTSGQLDGVGTSATLTPRALATDGTTLYVVQMGASGSLPGRRIDIATATVTTVPSMADGMGVTTDGSSLFFTTGTYLKKLH